MLVSLSFRFDVLPMLMGQEIQILVSHEQNLCCMGTHHKHATPLHAPSLLPLIPDLPSALPVHSASGCSGFSSRSLSRCYHGQVEALRCKPDSCRQILSGFVAPATH
uniref:Uncharacterized protein n=1 Tax=Pyrodinium bahamense TaxID=73915 RepID=A0A7S0FGA0_9DINO